jgi:hypothetical protein
MAVSHSSRNEGYPTKSQLFFSFSSERKRERNFLFFADTTRQAFSYVLCFSGCRLFKFYVHEAGHDHIMSITFSGNNTGWEDPPANMTQIGHRGSTFCIYLGRLIACTSALIDDSFGRKQNHRPTMLFRFSVETWIIKSLGHIYFFRHTTHLIANMLCIVMALAQGT